MLIGSYWRTDFLFGQSGTQETLGPMDIDNIPKKTSTLREEKRWGYLGNSSSCSP